MAVFAVLILVGIAIVLFLVGKKQMVCFLLPLDQCLADRWDGKAFLLPLTWQGFHRPSTMLVFKESGKPPKGMDRKPRQRLRKQDRWLEKDPPLDFKCAALNRAVFDEWQDSDHASLYWGNLRSCVCKFEDLRLNATGLPVKLSPVFWKGSKTTLCSKQKVLLVNAVFLEDDKALYDTVIDAFVWRS
jgi:hypothetical protein